MNCKKGELSEKDIKKENADLSASDLSDVSGGKLYVVGEDGRLLNPKGEGDAMYQPKDDGGTFLSPDDKPVDMVMDGDTKKNHIIPEGPEARP